MYVLTVLYKKSPKLNILDVGDKSIRTLHMSWFAFFLTFMVWFNHAPMKSFLTETFSLTTAQWKALLILNVAMTIPARIVVGMLVDRFGPRHVYSMLLVSAGLLCILFASAQNYTQLALARLLMGFVGAGFVIGIRLIGEWFPARQVGLAEGIYGGWGNFGSAAAAMTLPTLVGIFGGENGWRYAILMTGAFALVYGCVFYSKVRNTPPGATYFKPKKSGGLEVTSRKDFYFLIGMNVPMYICLGVLAWKLSPSGVSLVPQSVVSVVYVLLVALFAFQTYQIYQVNKDMLANGVDDTQKYSFRQVAILDVNYFVTFGSELAVVSMLSAFFMETFSLDPVKAGLFAAGFAFMNLLARPIGGLISDNFSRRATMLILVCGLAVGYFTMSRIDSSWPLLAAVACTMMCSFFVQSGEGAVFAMVPLIKRRLSGQIAGMVGAYGNVGAVTFLTVYSFVNASTFFMVIGASASLAFFASWFLKDPEGHTVEVEEDGTVQLIEVA